MKKLKWGRNHNSDSYYIYALMLVDEELSSREIYGCTNRMPSPKGFCEDVKFLSRSGAIAVLKGLFKGTIVYEEA